MEEETPRAHDEIATEGDQKDLVMLIPATAQNPLDPEPHKQQVGQGVDNLSRIDGGIVILTHKQR